MKRRGARGEGRRGGRWAVFLALMAVSVEAAPVVLSVDRMYRDDPGRLAEAGELLLTELHCVNCHAPEGELVDRIPVTAAPDLAEAGSRLRGSFIRNWLADPRRVDAESRMPDLMAALPKTARRTNSDALAQFLGSLAKGKPASVTAADADRGRALFHSVGCVACHAPRADFTETAAGEKVAAEDVKSRSVSLEQVAAKYTVESLAGFLQSPEKARPSGRMPGMQLSVTEAADLAAYLVDGGGSPPPSSSPDERAAYVGRRLFASVGCASCHGVEWRGERIESELAAPSLTELAGKTGGCLSSVAEHRTPHYGLDDFQRRALVSALMNLKHVSRLAPVDFERRRMARLNCYACHQRRGVGGPDAARLKYFTSSGADLGDEGRVPPALTGVGRKLREEAMVEIISGRFPARPYMTTRMPSFPEEHARALAAGFAKADHDPREQPTPRDGEENQVGRNMWGRALLGTSGLSCITCHEFRGKKSLGIPAIDLALSPKRLRPEWFRDYLLDPARYRPGTRMPAFWPNGKPMLKGHGGKAERQIDSLWVYLTEADQSRLPDGLEKKGNFLVTPTERPVVFRTFMEEAGMHAIAVGFPEGVHAAFDAKTPRWALAWTGRFIDAEGTWDDRFTPLAVPAGTNTISIQSLPPDLGRTDFLGYVTTRDQPPRLEYAIDGVEIHDSVRPVTGSSKRLRRTIARVASGAAVWVEVASGKKIAVTDAGWKVDGKLRVQPVPEGAKAEGRVKTAKDGQRLQFRLAPGGSESKSLSVAYEW